MITQSMCRSCLLELWDGIHAAADDYKIALFTSAATLNKNTTAYSTTNEVVGAGYTAGGQSLASRVSSLDGDVAIVDFANVSWPAATITARGALIYNASKANRAVAVLDFGQDVSSTAGTFSVTLPAATGAAALLRLTL